MGSASEPTPISTEVGPTPIVPLQLRHKLATVPQGNRGIYGLEHKALRTSGDGLDTEGNICSMSNAGSSYGEFRTALRTNSYGLAMQVARSLPGIDLSDALRLTALAAHKDPDRFPSLARRWLVRFLSERHPTLLLVSWVAHDFEDLANPEGLAFVKEEAESRVRLLEEKLRHTSDAPSIDEMTGFRA